MTMAILLDELCIDVLNDFLEVKEVALRADLYRDSKGELYFCDVREVEDVWQYELAQKPRQQ